MEGGSKKCTWEDFNINFFLRNNFRPIFFELGMKVTLSDGNAVEFVQISCTLNMTLKWDMKTLRGLICSYFRAGKSKKLTVFYTSNISLNFFGVVTSSKALKNDNYLFRNLILNKFKKMVFEGFRRSNRSKKFEKNVGGVKYS